MRYSMDQGRRWLKQSKDAVRKDHAQIGFLRMFIQRAQDELPLLEKQIERYEKMLPIWKKDLTRYESSLKTDRKVLEERQERVNLMSRIDKIRRTLWLLDKSKDT